MISKSKEKINIRDDKVMKDWEWLNFFTWDQALSLTPLLRKNRTIFTARRLSRFKDTFMETGMNWG